MCLHQQGNYFVLLTGSPCQCINIGRVMGGTPLPECLLGRCFHWGSNIRLAPTMAKKISGWMIFSRIPCDHCSDLHVFLESRPLQGHQIVMSLEEDKMRHGWDRLMQVNMCFPTTQSNKIPQQDPTRHLHIPCTWSSACKFWDQIY